MLIDFIKKEIIAIKLRTKLAKMRNRTLKSSLNECSLKVYISINL